ncbi:MAG: nickel/cobalt transporter [Hyphomicrobium sp.]
MRIFSGAVALCLALLLLAGAAFAEAEPKRTPLGLPMPPAAAAANNASGETADPPGLTERAWNWLLGMQQKFTREMTAAVRGLKAQGDVNAAAMLAFVSFLYGVLHAAGPGHGKAIISSYVLANERTVRRGIFLSFLAAGFQAVSAIVVVGVLAIALNATSLTIKATESWLETASWAFVAAVGAWMLYAQIAKLLPLRTDSVKLHVGHGHTQAHVHDHAACCGHDHGHAHGHKPEQVAVPKIAPAKAHDHAHHQSHSHDHAECCGHAHLPAPKDLEGDLSWGKSMAIAASIGIRPCTGAILVMIFALTQGLLWAGIFATFAMAFGTALTTSALAALAVGSKTLATRYAGEGSAWAGRIGTAAGLTGSTLVLVMGTAFFLASLHGQPPL